MTTAATTSMARRFGRQQRGQRLRCVFRMGIYKAITFVFGLRLKASSRPKAYDHAMNAETFEAWLEHHLLPILEEGDIVVLDDLKTRKSPRVAEILARKTADTMPAAIQPGLQPHRDGDFQTEKRAAKIGRAHRCRPSCYPGGLRRSLQARRMRKLFRGLRT